MRRKLLVAGVVIFAIVASSVRINHNKLGWGSYWAVDFVAPWQR